MKRYPGWKKDLGGLKKELEGAFIGGIDYCIDVHEKTAEEMKINEATALVKKIAVIPDGDWFESTTRIIQQEARDIINSLPKNRSAKG